MANLITQVTPLGSTSTYGVRASAIQYGTCATGSATAAKAVTCSSFTSDYLTAGAVVAVKFSYTNTATVGNLTLNVNSTGAKSIKTLISGVASNLPTANCLQSGRTYKFVYDGTYWVCDIGFSLVDDTMVFKGILGTGTGMVSLPTTPREAGWVYRVGTVGTYAGKTCEVGDMVVCVKDVASGGTTSNDDFAVIQANVDKPLYIGSNSLTDNAILVADGTSGQVKSATLTQQTISTVSSFSGGTAASLTTSNYTITPLSSAGTAPSLTTSTYTIKNPTVTAGTAASLSTITYTIPNITSVGTPPSLTTSTYTVNNPLVTAGTAASLTTSTYTIKNPTVTAGTAASLTTSTYTIKGINSTGTAFTATVSGEILVLTSGSAPTVSSYTIKGVNNFTANTPTAVSTTNVTIKGVNAFTANTPTAVSTTSVSILGIATNGWSAGTVPTLGNAFELQGFSSFTPNTPTAVSTTSVTIKGVNAWSAGSAATAGTAVTIKGVNTFTPNTIASLTTSSTTVLIGAGTYNSLSYASGEEF